MVQMNYVSTSSRYVIANDMFSRPLLKEREREREEEKKNRVSKFIVIISDIDVVESGKCGFMF